MIVCTECGVRVMTIEGVDLHFLGCSLSTPEGLRILKSMAEGAEETPSGMLLAAAGDRGMLATMASLRSMMSGDKEDDEIYSAMLESEAVVSVIEVASIAGATQMFSILVEQGLVDQEAFFAFEFGTSAADNEW